MGPSNCLRTERVGIVSQAVAQISNRSTEGPVRNNAELVREARRLTKERRERERMFPAVLFADPAWDILLDLTISKLEGVRVSVLSLCLAAPVPTTTAFRWIRRMEAKGLLVRTPDEADRRRIYIDLNDQMLATMVAYLDRVAARERATGDSWPC